MQISGVLKEVVKALDSVLEAHGYSVPLGLQIVNVVGGLSEHKQRRLLTSKAVHIVVATPGRICEILQEEDLDAFADMSRLRFLVVDEADRIMEEGHFSEVMLLFLADHLMALWPLF